MKFECPEFKYWIDSFVQVLRSADSYRYHLLLIWFWTWAKFWQQEFLLKYSYFAHCWVKCSYSKLIFFARFHNLWKMFLDFQIKQNTAICKVRLWPQIKKTIFWPLTGLFFIFFWTKSYLNILWFFTKAPLFLQEFKQKKNLDNEK